MHNLFFFDNSCSMHNHLLCFAVSGWSFGGRGQGHGKILVGKHVKVKSGPYKGYHGQVVGFKGVIVRVELESLMKTINCTAFLSLTVFFQSMFCLGCSTYIYGIADCNSF